MDFNSMLTENGLFQNDFQIYVTYANTKATLTILKLRIICLERVFSMSNLINAIDFPFPKPPYMKDVTNLLC